MNCDLRKSLEQQGFRHRFITQGIEVNRRVNPAPVSFRLNDAGLGDRSLLAHFPTPPPQPIVSRVGSGKQINHPNHKKKSKTRVRGSRVEGVVLGRGKRQ